MNILFIITSSIAAQKCEKILNYLVNKKFNVDCILTEKTKRILNYKKLKKIINGNIYSDKSEKNNKMLHIELTRKADLVVVCPATANTIAKYANGFADNLATTSLIASNKQIIFVPAMNSQMWNNKINKKNVKFLLDSGIEFIGPEFGKLSCGETGLGRLSDEIKITQRILNKFKKIKEFKGKNFLVTAGPTIEQLDPLRFISNNSSGKQGYEIANEIALRGGKVTLVSGPTHLPKPSNVKLVKISNTNQMYKEIKKIKKVDVGIFAAAVADFKPKRLYNHKIIKNEINQIELKKNIDILKNIGKNKNLRPKILVGFAAETKNNTNPKKKLIDKNCDLIICNKINNSNKVFGLDNNKISIVTNKKIIKYPKMSKTNCAKKILDFINDNYFNNI